MVVAAPMDCAGRGKQTNSCPVPKGEIGRYSIKGNVKGNIKRDRNTKVKSNGNLTKTPA